MNALEDDTLFKLVHDFLRVYLPSQRRASEHTTMAYRTTLNQLLGFVKERYGIGFSDITIGMLGKETVVDYLDYVERHRHCSIRTRNHRLACIRSFFEYAASMEATLVYRAAELRKIPLKKPESSATVEHMSEEAVKALLEEPDISTAKGLRDRFLMILLYDTGARIQELLGIRIGDVQLGSTPIVLLHGKGNKVRTVPIMQRTAEHFKEYVAKLHDPMPDLDSHLFFAGRKDARHKMSDDNVRKLLRRYSSQARKKCRQVPQNAHPHLWRHSRAMHLYQHGMDLTLVSQWLGHSDPSTTLIYAYADTEHKRRAIGEAMAEQGILSAEMTSASYKIDDEQRLKRLYGLA
jgi:site-specific recombinase XerD